MFQVKIKRKALRKLQKLDQKRRKNVREIVLILKTDPLPFRRADVNKLKGYDNIYRIRIGDLRIVYEVFWSVRTVIIHYIGPREKAYERRI